MAETDYPGLLLWQITASGLPAPQREVRFHPSRRWRFDLAWDAPYRLAVEVDGGLYRYGRHQQPAGYENDCIKLAEAAIAGWAVIRVTPRMVVTGEALTLVERALRAREG